MPIRGSTIVAKQEQPVLVTEGYINGRRHEVLRDSGASIDVGGKRFIEKHPSLQWTQRNISIQGVNSTNILNSSASTEADISFEGGIMKTVDRIY